MNLGHETGRSMVEMIGVLAIVGVLSISGIAGYSYAMDRYRANETVRNISLRTVDLMTQVSQGHPALSFAEWESKDTIYDFSNPAYSDDGLIMFDVGVTKKLPKSVCEMVFGMLSNTAVQIDINESPAQSKDICSADNTMTFYFDSGNAGNVETGEQCGNSVCGTCQKCNTSTNTCVTVSDYEEQCTTDDDKIGWCVGGSCQSEATCDCPPNYYCGDENNNCSQPSFSGQCNSLDFETEEIDGKTYYVSKETMSWWDGVSACKALGPGIGMVTMSELGYNDDGSEWVSGSQEGYISQTDLAIQLHEKMGIDYVWVAETYDACNAYDIYLQQAPFMGIITVYEVWERHKEENYVICR